MIYILIAGVVGFIGGSLNFAPWYNIHVLPVTTALVSIWVVNTTYAIIRYRLLDITLIITRTGIFVAVYSIVLGLPFALAFLGQNKLVEIFGKNWWMIPLIASTILATVGPFLYLFIQKKAEDQLYQEQRRYQTTLRQAATGMGKIRHLKKLLSFIVHILTRTVRVHFAGIYIYDHERHHFRLDAIRSRHLHQPMLTTLSKESKIVQHLVATQSPLIFEELKQQALDYADENSQKIFSEVNHLNAAIIVPCFINNDLTAIMVLGNKISGTLYSADDLVVFTILARQLALGIDSIRVFDEAKRSQDKLYHAEKLAYVGQMAASIVHEIRNPLTAIKTFVEYLPQRILHNDQEFLNKFDQIIPQEISRIEKIVHQLLDLARPRKINKRSIAITSVIDFTVELLKDSLELRKISIAKNYSAKNDTLSVDPELMQQVILNLIQNAMDAIVIQQKNNSDMDYQGRIMLGVCAEIDGIVISIVDNGPGIEEGQLRQLFTAFATTKQHGVGLGLVITKEIVELHGGSLQVKTQLGQGTEFMIKLKHSA